jgi:hypothetical protein
MRANGTLRVIPTENIEIPDLFMVNKTELFQKVFSIEFFQGGNLKNFDIMMYNQNVSLFTWTNKEI